jgi:hypothetical protein
VARAKPWDWALRRRRPSFYCERWTMVDAAGLAPAFSCLRGRRLPARLHARLVHEAGFDPPPPGSEPGALPVAPLVSLEEGVRFGLTSPQGDPVFETGALSRSATLPSPGAAGPAPEPPHTLARTTGVAPATFRSTAGCSAFELRPQHAGQPGRIRTSDCSFVGCHDHPFHHGPVGGVASGTRTRIPGFTAPCSPLELWPTGRDSWARTSVLLLPMEAGTPCSPVSRLVRPARVALAPPACRHPRCQTTDANVVAGTGVAPVLRAYEARVILLHHPAGAAPRGAARGVAPRLAGRAGLAPAPAVLETA